MFAVLQASTHNALLMFLQFHRSIASIFLGALNAIALTPTMFAFLQASTYNASFVSVGFSDSLRTLPWLLLLKNCYPNITLHWQQGAQSMGFFRRKIFFWHA